MITLTATARCHHCDWTAAGDWPLANHRPRGRAPHEGRAARDRRHGEASMTGWLPGDLVAENTMNAFSDGGRCALCRAGDPARPARRPAGR